MSFAGQVEEVRVSSLAGLGASYRIGGIFKIRATDGTSRRINYKGVAFGGHYGGHNVSVEISKVARKNIASALECKDEDVESVLAEVQRRLLNGEMIVEHEKLKPDVQEPLGNLGI